MAAPGLEPAAGRGFQRFFRRWGSKANIRSIWNSVLPVAVIDRYYGDEEGSYQAITAFTEGTIPLANQFPSILIGSADENVDLLIHQLAIWLTMDILGTPPGATIQHDVFLFTPVADYDPVLTLSPAGFFDSGLITPPSFTRGATVALGGYNPALPTGSFGLTYSKGIHPNAYARGRFLPPSANNTVAGGDVLQQTRDDWMRFDPPLRLPDGVTLACQWDTRLIPVGNIPIMWATFLYTERRLS